MLVNVQVSGWTKEYKDLTPEQWQELRKILPLLEPTKPEYGFKTIADFDTLSALCDYKLDVNLSTDEVDKSVNTMLVKLQDRIRSLELKDETNEATLYKKGAIVQIHIPDLALLYINEVDVLEDCCTNLLQDRLDKGWKIIAVCPPNAQRRPDYILGRRK